MKKIYPIILFAYNRPNHTLQVLRSLRANYLADESELYIFIDGIKTNADEHDLLKAREVREICRSTQWCKSVIIQDSETNLGCRNSVIEGISKVLKKHQAAIILEDDIVTSRWFLTYMNKCLDFYKDYKSVYSISGTTLPESKFRLPDSYHYDVYVSLRQLNSGWGTWADRWNSINWDLSFVNDFLSDEYLVKAFSRAGDDLIGMLVEQTENKIDAWDIQFTYNQFRNHAVSILPRYSYTDNIGGDGSGTHHLDKNTSMRFDLEKAIQMPKLLDIIYEDSRIINQFYNAFTSLKRPLWQKAVNRLVRNFGGENVFTIKKKIYL